MLYCHQRYWIKESMTILFHWRCQVHNITVIVSNALFQRILSTHVYKNHSSCATRSCMGKFDVMRPKHNGSHFADNISEVQFLKSELLYFDSNLSEVSYLGTNWQEVIIDSGDGSAPNKQQTIISCNDDPICIPRPNVLTHLPLDKMAAISQKTFSNACSWMKSFIFWFKFHWSLFLSIKLTIFQHWFR